MNISVNQNQSPSFGIFKLQGNSAKTIARVITSNADPVAAEKSFIENIAEPINRLKSTVICDNSVVNIIDASKNEVEAVLDTNMGKFAVSRAYRADHLNFFTNICGSGYYPIQKTISFENSEAAAIFQQQVCSSPSIIANLLCAKLYLQQKENSTDVVAQRLNNLYA